MPDALRPLGGLAVVASMFLPWVDRGSGSTVPLRSLGDLVLSGDLGDRAPPWIGLVVYLIPLAGALIVLADGLGDRGRRLGSIAFWTAAVLVIVGVVVPLLHDRRPGAGQWVAVAGLLLVGSGRISDRRRRIPARSTAQSPAPSTARSTTQTDCPAMRSGVDR